MRFLLLNQFYPPDVAPTGQYLHDLARSLVQRGHQVKVLCSRRSYNGTKTFPPYEQMDGVEVVRLAATGFGRRGFLGKIADYSSFYGRLLWTLFFERQRPDVILSLTTPPYIGLLAKLAAGRHRCRHAHWIMDLYPDAMFAHGMARKNGMPSRLLCQLTRWQFKGADRIFTLGPKMADRILTYCDNLSSRICWIPLWSTSEPTTWPDNEPNPLRAARGWHSDDIIFLYSGNMGLGHRFNEFLEAARQLSDSKIRWVFAGDGKRRSEIEAFAKSNPAASIQFLEGVPYAQLRAHLCSADVHLASMDSAWQGTMVPSKLQGSFAVGRPVLYVGGRDCETALWILQSGGGWVAEEDDLPGLLLAIQQASDPEERRRRGQAALEFARGNFLKSTSCARFVEMLENGNSSNKVGKQKTEILKTETAAAFLL
jgi:colanic acid biosynthesis glycosyl transferase WcaI